MAAATPTKQRKMTYPPSAGCEIAGVGLVTSLGDSAWQTFRALLEGRHITDRLDEDRLQLPLPARIASIGSCASSVRSSLDPSIDLAEKACRQALGEAGETGRDLPMFLGISKGAMHAWVKLAARLDNGCAFDSLPASLAEVVSLGPSGVVAEHLRRRLGLGVVEPMIAACASSLIALHRARCALMQPAGPRVVVVATSEAALLPTFIGSYHRLGVLPRDHDFHPRPLDDRRQGFIPAEMAAAVVLRRAAQPSTPPVKQRDGLTNIKKRAWLMNTTCANESHDLVQPAPGMPALDHVARQLLSEPVDVLHPHATGTREHDPEELSIYARHLKQREEGRPTQVYAAKGAIGHGLGAAGLVSAVLAVMMGRTGKCPPMPWLEQPIEVDRQRFALSRELATGEFARHAIFAAGFGGHTAGAVVEVDRDGW